ncbi:MAG: Ribosomal protein methyltransferase [Verrucomicrobiales bacterium]|nr:Ribosomal protein methyltransferase [Verrucomicrobiales bacterium]
MKTRVNTAKPLFRISVTVPQDAEEAVAEMLLQEFGTAAVIYTNAETKISCASNYTTKRFSSANLRDLEQRIHSLSQFGLPAKNAKVECNRVKREDWSESWKKYFTTIEIGSRLLIKPSWTKQRAVLGQAVVVLDPGLSFGTGQHATTSFCLKQLVKARDDSRPQSFLDIGSGSGILAISAVKLGYRPVQAFDFDPLAVRIANANAKRNRVENKVRFVRKDLTKVNITSKPSSDVICANLMAGLLLREKEKIIGRLKPAGTLILAGILTTEFHVIRSAFEKAGLQLSTTRVEREWQSGAFCFR